MKEQSASLALLFSGQGSQHVGMLEPLFKEKAFSRVIHDASAILSLDLKTLALTGPQNFLDKTSLTQPMVYTLGYACWQLLKEQLSSQPVVAAGHSLGELTALAAAEVFTFEEGLQLVQARAHAMQDCVGEGFGMMAVLGLSFSDVESVLEPLKGVFAANDNAENQVVIAGEKAKFGVAEAALREKGARRFIALGVSVPSHCPLMAKAGEVLALKLQDITLKMPKFPVIHNLDASLAKSKKELKEKLILQVTKPVRWCDTMKKMAKFNASHVVECGPGKVLKDLSRRALPLSEVLSSEYDLQRIKEIGCEQVVD